eukprot:1790821-Rhodomonas_salina.1
MTGTALLMKQQQESKELPQPAKKLLLPEPLYPTTLLWSGLSGPQIVFSRYDLKPLMRTNLMCIVAPSQSMLGGGKKQPCPSARARHFHRAAVLCFSAGLVVGGFGGNESGPTVFPTALYQRSLSESCVVHKETFLPAEDHHCATITEQMVYRLDARDKTVSQCNEINNRPPLLTPQHERERKDGVLLHVGPGRER